MTTESYSEDAAEFSAVDVLYWPHIAKIGFIECDSKTKQIHVPGWQKLDLDKIDYEANLKAGLYKNGIVIRLGKCLSPSKLFSFALDFDGWDAIVEWFGSWENVLEMSKRTRIEWHGDKGSLHMILLCNRSVKNRKIKIKDSLLEIRCEDNLLFSHPSYHMDGNQWVPLGTNEVAILAEPQLLQLEARVESLCEGYMSDVNKSVYIKWLENLDNWKSLGVGQGRHNALVVLGTSFYYRYSNGWHDMTDDQRKAKLWEMNLLLKVPKPESEFNLIWRWIVDKHRKTRDQQHEDLDKKNSKYRYRDDGSYGRSNLPELESVFYQINEKPPKFIIAYDRNKHVIEATIKEKTIEHSKEPSEIVVYLDHNKTYLTCIPSKIVRHKNPLTFLDQAAKYTMTFVDAAGEHYTFSHKTLSEILAGLRELGYVFSDGAEGALGTMVQAFKENKIIEDNEDMDFTGFFIVDNKIIPSNIEIKEVAAADLEDALKYIEELVPYYEGRLDLLSTLIVWGLVAPTIFMLKTNNYFLKWFHFYGFPNATKSNSGKIVLGIDGHQDNPDFILNISRIDTIARLGDILSHTTFSKLVDEADLNPMDKGWLINAMKSAIEGKIARSKFLTNRSTSSTPIPALSPLILTSNSPPPFHDSGYMRRIIDRNFAKSESHKEDDPIAIKFKEFLRTDLSRLRHLGDFRNWFIVNNQDIFLDETRLLPLDLGLKILTTAYEKTGREMPKWFNMRLPECQLEDSIGDNTVIVKRAFETYIDVNFKNSLSFWRLEGPEGLKLPDKVSHRIVQLIDSNLLPDIKRTQSHEIIIRKGVLLELYKYGVTREQLPNLRALADYMNANYRKSDGNKVVSCTESQLEDYFDKIEVAVDNV